MRTGADKAASCLPFRIRGHGGVDGNHGVVRGQQGDGCVPGRHARSGPSPVTVSLREQP